MVPVKCSERCITATDYIICNFDRLEVIIVAAYSMGVVFYYLGCNKTLLGKFFIYIRNFGADFIIQIVFYRNMFWYFIICDCVMFVSIFLFIFEGLYMFVLVFMVITVPFGYFVLLAHGLALFIPGWFASYPELMIKIWPFLLVVLQSIYTWILKRKIYERIHNMIRLVLIVFYMVFKALSIGNMHQIVTMKGIWSQDLWINLMVSFVLTFDKKMMISNRFKFNLFKRIGIYKKNAKFEVGIMEAIYIDMKLEMEMELYITFAYFIVITSKYFIGATNLIIDCTGRHIVNVSFIDNNHF